jgi:hypothetical protein
MFVPGIRVAVLTIGALASAPVWAATLDEAAMPGGAFGSAWNDLTTVAAGYDVISGTGSQNRFDNFVFTLPAGHQTLSFDFAAPAGYGYSYSAGGQILTSTEPFRWSWDGTSVHSIQVDYDKPQDSFTLDLGDFKGGALYLALDFTHGADLGYTIGVPGNALPAAPAPAPVPLPAGVLLLGSGLAALAALGRRRQPA